MHKTASPPSPRPGSRPRGAATERRLLDAAERVFARDGLEGATTRAIARAAGVNEVTLFRHFGTKERLIAAVVGRRFVPDGRAPDPDSSDLPGDLAAFARRYRALLVEHLPLIRTLLGEIHRHRNCQRQVLDGVFRPMRADLVARLERAQAAGEIGPAVAPPIVADLLAGVVLADVLRRTSPTAPREYSAEQYQAAGIDALLRGLAERGTSGRR